MINENIRTDFAYETLGAWEWVGNCLRILDAKVLVGLPVMAG